MIWSEPTDADKDGIYEYRIFGTKVIVSADNIVSASGKHKLLELNEGRTLYSLDSAVDPVTGKVESLMLLTEPSGSSTVTSAVIEYKNLLTVEEPDYEYEDILPGFEMPVQFTVRNDGIDTISHLTIEIDEQDVKYEGESLAPGEERKYLVYHTVPDPVTNANYTVTAQFGATGETGVQTGTLKLGLPDAGIYKIDRTNETHRERGFRVLLQNTAFAKLKSGIHEVKLEVWDNADFETESFFKTFILTDDDLNAINDSMLSLDITLTEEELQRFLDENGEIPKGGATVFFRTVVTQDGEVVEDANISNDIAYMNIYSLVEKNGTAISLASLSETTGGKTTVQVEATNNSMNLIDNGNIIVTLRDETGNVLETQQTYNSSDSSLLTIPGEEPKTASVLFNHTGYTADVAFSRVSEESTLLSVLNLTGIPLEFNPNVFEYSIKVYDLIQTNLTAVAENPSSIISVTKNGFPISISAPISMSYGITIFVITVTTGESNKTYTVTVNNNKIDYDQDPGEDHGKSSGSSPSYDYYAGLTINGIKQSDVSIKLKDGQAVVSLGSLMQDIFERNTEIYLEIPAILNTESYSLEIPASTLANPYTGAALIVSTELGSVRIPAGMLAGIPHLEGKTAGINISAADRTRLPEDIRAALGNHPLLSLTLTLDGEKVDWNNSDAPVTVCIPYLPTAEELENPESIVIWYIDGNGGAVCVPNGRYDPITGTVIFSTTHFSDFAVAYNKVSFNDVAENAWYSKPVSFIAARGITAGTSKGKYSPEAILTRGEFLVLLMRAYNILPDENPTENFSDGGNGYFTGYLAAAKRLGISVGVGNNMFAPNNEITRQEMFAMLYNALEALNQLPEGGSNRNLSDFTDAELISPWAKKAMTLLVETGTIVGSNGVLNPHGKTTRAQMAQALYNLFSR